MEPSADEDSHWIMYRDIASLISKNAFSQTTQTEVSTKNWYERSRIKIDPTDTVKYCDRFTTKCSEDEESLLKTIQELFGIYTYLMKGGPHIEVIERWEGFFEKRGNWEHLYTPEKFDMERLAFANIVSMMKIGERAVSSMLRDGKQIMMPVLQELIRTDRHRNPNLKLAKFLFELQGIDFDFASPRQYNFLGAPS